MAYNGWKNYETWAVGMYLDGNYDGEGTYRHVLEMAEEIKDETGESGNFNKYLLSERIKDFVEESIGDIGGLAQDLIGAALSEVDWDELAESRLSELAEA